MGTLGGGNHFIEVCLDETNQVWVMLHSGSRGIGNAIASYFIALARKDMERWMIQLPDRDLAYFPEGSEHFADYVEAVHWAQDYAMQNRTSMLELVLAALQRHLPPFTVTTEAVNCHHNYVAQEHHYGENVWVTRKGAIRAREGDPGHCSGQHGCAQFHCARPWQSRELLFQRPWCRTKDESHRRREAVHCGRHGGANQRRNLPQRQGCD
jgi:tRNA-splicing ligase RtcB